MPVDRPNADRLERRTLVPKIEKSLMAPKKAFFNNFSRKKRKKLMSSKIVETYATRDQIITYKNVYLHFKCFPILVFTILLSVSLLQQDFTKIKMQIEEYLPAPK